MSVAMNNKNLSLSGRKVLVVDDEEEILVITRLMLELHGAEVITSLTAAEGLEQVQTQRLDLIISDISMPHMDGYQFIQAVRNLPMDKGKDIPAVALSVLGEGSGHAKAINAGFQKYLCKPIRFATLIGTVAGVAGINPNNARQ